MWAGRVCRAVCSDDSLGLERDAVEQRVGEGLGLLENFFLHEVLVTALFDRDWIKGNDKRRAVHIGAIKRRDAGALPGELGHLAVL